MQIFKKVIVATVAFVLFLCAFSSVFIAASDRKEDFYDSLSLSHNKELMIPQGTDFLVCGASHCAMGFVPEELDRFMNVSSYNISVQAMKFYGRYEILKNVLKQCQIQTVVLELSYDCLDRPERESRLGDLYTFQYYRHYLSAAYIISHPVAVNDYLNLFQDKYNKTMNDGATHLIQRMLKREAQVTYERIQYNKKENRGFECFPTVSVSLADGTSASLHASEKLENAPLDANINALKKCVDLCHEYGVRVVFAVTPLSDAFLWKHSGWDVFSDQIQQIADEMDCELYDFNLLRNRNDLFQDDLSFYNETHLSENGAKTFTKVFSEMLLRAESKNNVEDEFYETYEEMLQNSPYNMR